MGVLAPARAPQCHGDGRAPPRFFAPPRPTPNEQIKDSVLPKHLNQEDINRKRTLGEILRKDFEKFAKSAEVSTFKCDRALPLYDTGPTFVFVRDGSHLPLAKEFPFKTSDDEFDSVEKFDPLSFAVHKPGIATMFEADVSWLAKDQQPPKPHKRLRQLGQIEPTTLEHELPNTMMISKKKNVVNGQTYAGLKTMPPGSYSKFRVAHGGK